MFMTLQLTSFMSWFFARGRSTCACLPAEHPQNIAGYMPLLLPLIAWATTIALVHAFKFDCGCWWLCNGRQLAQEKTNLNAYTGD